MWVWLAAAVLGAVAVTVGYLFLTAASRQARIPACSGPSSAPWPSLLAPPVLVLFLLPAVPKFPGGSPLVVPDRAGLGPRLASMSAGCTSATATASGRSGRRCSACSAPPSFACWPSSSCCRPCATTRTALAARRCWSSSTYPAAWPGPSTTSPPTPCRWINSFPDRTR